MTHSTETRSVLYWVYSPFGDPILHVPDHAEALAYAREVKGRTLEVIVETTSRTALPVEAASPLAIRTVEDPEATRRSDGRKPPAGYTKLSTGVRCRCVHLWQQANGEYWCCRPDKEGSL